MFRFPWRKHRKPVAPKFTPKIDLLEDRLTPVVIANPDPNYQVGAGQVLTVPIQQGVLINDFDDEDAGAVLTATLEVGAKFTGVGAPPLPVGSLTLSQNGSFTFIAPSNYNPNFGNVTFTYRAVNRDTGDFATAQVTINIVGVAGRQKLFAVAAGEGGGPQVRVFDAQTGTERFSFFPYESSFTGGVRVTTGDLNRDGVDDIVVAPASGGSARIKVYDGKFGTLLEDFQVFEDTFRGGADVAIGDINGDRFNDLIVGAGEGGGPRVVVYDGTFAGDLNTPTQSTLSANKLMDFFAYETTFRNGVRVAAGDLDGLRRIDPTIARDYVVTGTFAGGGPSVRVFDGIQVKNALQIGIDSPPALRSFFGFDPDGRNGINVAVGQFRTDGKADIVVGTGGGFSVVRVFDGRNLTMLREFSVPTGETPTGNAAPSGGQAGTIGGLFQAGAGTAAAGTPTTLITAPSSLTTTVGGVRVGTADRNGDGLSDIVTGLGPGVQSRIRIFDGTSLQEVDNFLAFPATFLGGVYVGGNGL